jgi:hypothetical protein
MLWEALDGKINCGKSATIMNNTKSMPNNSKGSTEIMEDLIKEDLLSMIKIFRTKMP